MAPGHQKLEDIKAKSDSNVWWCTVLLLSSTAHWTAGLRFTWREGTSAAGMKEALSIRAQTHGFKGTVQPGPAWVRTWDGFFVLVRMLGFCTAGYKPAHSYL